MIDVRIVRFFRKHHVLTLATSENNVPWCANCFYVYMEEENTIIFTTDSDTRHGREFISNPRVSGSVVLETLIIGMIRGIQFTGVVKEVAAEDLSRAKNAYIRRFPVAALMNTRLWKIIPDHIKMTDNRLGFGKKLTWDKEESS
ncbi:MAG TPA: pyridoxamine 5'-phosphate oxidase family protein [Bacteroidales bacterium]|jgi:uncharacterized protein YhbP (UPF0306 family)|nr:pyridoxamine 5'-phosphate oxidase family protein [Bacteroidales bacterium]